MCSRTFCSILTIMLTATPLVAGDKFTTKGPKTAVADCYATKEQPDTDQVVYKKEWPGTITCIDTYKNRGLFQIGSRKCWIERSELEITGLPGPEECDSSHGGLSNRGLNDNQCPKKKQKH